MKPPLELCDECLNMYTVSDGAGCDQACAVVFEGVETQLFVSRWLHVTQTPGAYACIIFMN